MKVLPLKEKSCKYPKVMFVYKIKRKRISKIKKKARALYQKISRLRARPKADRP